MKFIKAFFNFIFKTFLFLFDTLFSLILIYWLIIATIILFGNCSVSNLIQLFLFYIIVFIFIFALYFLLFSKITFKSKIVYFFMALLLLLIGFNLPTINLANNIDSCLNSGNSWNFKKNICEIN